MVERPEARGQGPGHGASGNLLRATDGPGDQRELLRPRW